MKIYRYSLVIFTLLLFMASSAFAQKEIQNPRLFKHFNPDGKKYYFVKDYLTSLSYLQYNVELNEVINEDVKEQEKIEQVEMLRHNMVQNNVNLRVARNYLNKYAKSRENGLILLATDQFKQACNQLIELNTDERVQLEYYYEALHNKDEESFNLDDFKNQRAQIHTQRREASKLLLETSILVGKILISNEVNYFGEFDTLGISQEERYHLLDKLDGFGGKNFDGDIRAGQTFLEGSISAIREVLEDYRYSSNGS